MKKKFKIDDNDSLEYLFTSLGVTSRAGYRLVDMLQEDEEYNSAEIDYKHNYVFTKGDCLILNGLRHIVKNTKEEDNELYAYVLHFNQLINPNAEGKWILQKLLPLPIAHINIDKKD